jgi:putative RNA 2'-phosphotransferase
MEKKHIRISRFLSYVLRHHPDAIGLVLDANGWADIDALLAACAAHGRTLERGELDLVVAQNDKRRFAVSEDGRRIRASQGHSVSVDLGYEPCVPPEVLYHGTAARFLEEIRRDGLRRGTRLHVHLSADEETAQSVGARHGVPVVLRVRAGEMSRAGVSFFISANEVWLTERVGEGYIDEL